MNKIVQKIAIGVSTLAVAATAYVIPAMAITPAPATTVVVTPPLNSQGWSSQDTTAGGNVNFIFDATSPLPTGALQLLTDTTTTAKASYMHAANNTALAGVTALSYDTKQVTAPFPGADPSYQLPVCLTGAANRVCNPGLLGTTQATSFDTLVFEPYQNTALGAVVPGQWQQWDVSSGLFWSTRTVVCSNGTITGTQGGPATYTLSAIKTACPEAVVVGFGVNIGSNNPSYNVETDKVTFNGTTYNFEVMNPTPTMSVTPSVTVSPTVKPTPSIRPPKSKDACKDDGYKGLTDANGQAFKNQGQCVSYFNQE